MSYYEDIYRKRLNRYGNDYQSRIQGKREREFEDYLKKTIYLVSFEYEGEEHPASLEHFKQDYTEIVAYLLTRIDLKLPNGTVLNIVNQDGTTTPWMIWWLQSIEASGYNRYTVLKMTHTIDWKDDEGEHSDYAYFYGPGTSRVRDTVMTDANVGRYTENNNLHMFILPTHTSLRNAVYITVRDNPVSQGYIVKEVDNLSTPGIGYVSVDPTFERHEQAPIEHSEGSEDASFYWLNGGE